MNYDILWLAAPFIAFLVGLGIGLAVAMRVASDARNQIRKTMK